MQYNQVVKSLLYEKVIDYLKGAKVLDTSLPPEQCLDVYYNIMNNCVKGNGLGYITVGECIKHNIAKYIQQHNPVYEKSYAIFLNEDNELEIIDYYEIANTLKYDYYINLLQNATPISTTILEKYAINKYIRVSGRDLKYVGFYHSHPFTVPLPSSADVNISYFEDTLIDAIDNSTVGIVFAIGGWKGFSRVINEYHDGWIYVYPSKNANRIVPIKIYKTEKMLKITHENLLDNSKYNPNKIYVWKKTDGTILKYENGIVEEVI